MAYNFSNTYKQPLNEFTIPEGESGITGLLSGLSSGYAAGKTNKARSAENKTFKNDFKAMIGTDPTQAEIDMNLQARGIKPGNFMSDFTGAALGAEGVGKLAKNPAMAEQIRGFKLGNDQQQQENTLFNQVMQDVGGLVDKFKNTGSTDERLKLIKDNAGISLVPQGAQLLGRMAQITQQLATIESKSEAAIIAHQDRLNNAELLDYGWDPKDPDSKPFAQRNRTADEFYKMLKIKGITLDGPIPEEIFLPNGKFNRVMAVPFVESLERKQQEIGNVPITTYEDPETGQRYVMRGRQMIKSGVSQDVEEQKTILDAQLDSIQGQLRSINADPLLRFNAPERTRLIQELESKQQELIKTHYQSRRSPKTAPVNGATPSASDEFQSTDSSPMTIKIAPNGKKALFDSVTKQFIRYAQ